MLGMNPDGADESEAPVAPVMAGIEEEDPEALEEPEDAPAEGGLILPPLED
jgi:hypothetical protein